MADPFIGEIRISGFSFAPPGWLPCDGSLLPISEYETLYNLLGTVYGGDGVAFFALPDLRGRVAVHQGNALGTNYPLGQRLGNETVTLNTSNLPSHGHPVTASETSATTSDPTGNLFAKAPDSSGVPLPVYSSSMPDSIMSPASVGVAGGSQSISILAPVQCVNFIIATEGLYPSSS